MWVPTSHSSLLCIPQEECLGILLCQGWKETLCKSVFAFAWVCCQYQYNWLFDVLFIAEIPSNLPVLPPLTHIASDSAGPNQEASTVMRNGTNLPKAATAASSSIQSMSAGCLGSTSGPKHTTAFIYSQCILWILQVWGLCRIKWYTLIITDCVLLIRLSPGFTAVYMRLMFKRFLIYIHASSDTKLIYFWYPFFPLWAPQTDIFPKLHFIAWGWM